MAADDAGEGVSSFDEMGLDARLLKAIQKRGYESPTPVQSKCVPAALEGKDIVGLAKTGSGKTVAYLLPAVNKILAGGSKAAWQALILVPTRELCQQVGDEATQFSKCCGGAFGVTVLAHQGHGPAARAALAAAGEVVVATPARVAQSLQDGALSASHLKSHLQTMVLDEADLLLSYGYEGDVRTLAPHVPRSCQCLLMSATTSRDVDTLTQLVLHSPVRLDLTAVGGVAAAKPGGDDDTGTVRAVDHHTVACKNEDRLLNLLALLRLGLVPRKALIFVNSIDNGFKVKLFLEAFGVRAAVLNGELPLNSRHHILQEFNRGLFDYLIATDDGKTLPAKGAGDEEDGGEDAEAGEGKKRKKGKKRSKRVVDGEFGVVRGVDFKGVRTVLNFDLPPSLSSYVHRVGRTGRAGARGVAVTLLPATPEARALAEEVRAHLVAAEGLGGGAAGGAEGELDEDEEKGLLTPFPTLTKDSVEGLRYRGEDVARTVTKLAVREARAKELRLEILNSDRLKSHFEDNPGDLALLKHDKPLSKGPSAPHLKQVPGYLRDPKALPANRSKVGGGHVSREVERPRKRRRDGGGGRGGGNPLKTFKTSAFARASKVGGKSEEVSAFEKTVMDGMWSKSTKKDRKVPGQRPNEGVRKTNVRKNKRKRSR